jgi:hypothetical protein
VEKLSSVRQATDNNKYGAQKDAICMLVNPGNNTDTYSLYLILIVFPRQQWLRESLSLLRLRTLSILFAVSSAGESLRSPLNYIFLFW